MTLKAHALACERNGRVVFSGLNFEVADGQCAELRGPNGSGKSSLLRLVAGLLPPSHGTLTFGGHAAIPELCHLIAHQDAMKPHLTVLENLEFWCAMLDGEGIAAALAAFALEGLRDEQAQVLSAGQKRRLALSRLFLCSRPLWLLDEPATALDRDSLAVLKRHVQRQLAEGGIVMMATHDDVFMLAGTTIVLGAPMP